MVANCEIAQARVGLTGGIRRRYFNNGAHAGFVYYTNDPNLTEDDGKALQAKIVGSEGVRNFRPLFVNIPGGSDKAIQIIPVGALLRRTNLNASRISLAMMLSPRGG